MYLSLNLIIHELSYENKRLTNILIIVFVNFMS